MKAEISYYMYSETFMNYLLKYQTEDFKGKEEAKTTTKHFSFDDIKAKKYVAVPINHEAN